MKATLKYVTINVYKVKPGYIVLCDNTLKIVKSAQDETAVLTNYDDDSIETEVLVTDIRRKVVKFLAIVNNTTYSIIHGNFTDIIAYFNNNKDLLQTFIDRKGSIEINGVIKHILAYPVINDVVTLIDLKVASIHSLLENKLDRVGMIKSISGNKFEVDFRTCTLTLNRSQFKIATVNSKEVFTLC